MYLLYFARNKPCAHPRSSNTKGGWVTPSQRTWNKMEWHEGFCGHAVENNALRTKPKEQPRQ